MCGLWSGYRLEKVYNASVLSISHLVLVNPQEEGEWLKYMPLYKAALNGDWDKTEEILRKDPNAEKARVGHTLQTALHVAVGGGKSTSFVAKLVNMMSDDSLAMENGNGLNPLHVAAWTGNLPAAEILVRRLPDLLYVADKQGYFPVHSAAFFGHRKTLEFLMLHTKDQDSLPNPFAGPCGLCLLNFLIDADYFGQSICIVIPSSYRFQSNVCVYKAVGVCRYGSESS